MKKIIIGLLLALVYTASVTAQDEIYYDTKGITFLHVGNKGELINPSDPNAKGMFTITEINSRGNENAIDRPSKYTVPGDTRQYRDAADPTSKVGYKKIVEKRPPAGYKPSHMAKIFYYNANGDLLWRLTKNLVDGVIEWDPTIDPPYFAVIFYNDCIDNTCVEEECIIKPTPFTIQYQIKDSHQSGGTLDNQNTGNLISVNYQAIRIGEYYWMNSNFTHEEPARYWWNTIMSGDETKHIHASNPEYYKQDNRLTTDRFNKYMDQMQLTGFTLSVSEFESMYGRYYSYYTWEYMQRWGKMLENGQINTAWGLPYIEDFRQLVAMSPFNEIEGSHTSLNERDFRMAFSADKNLNKATQMRPFPAAGSCEGHGTYWFDANSNVYGFNMTPNGARLNGGTNLTETQPWYTNFCGSDRTFYGVKGDIYHLFYTVKYPTRSKGSGPGNAFSLHDAIDTDVLPSSGGYPYSYHWMPARWCRRLTDAELGYKIFIKVNSLSTTSKEWTQLQAGNDIPLLIAIRNNRVVASNVVIQKVNNPTAAAPTGFIELPKGYLRGFYVQHRIQCNNTKVTDADIINYAANVQDAALGYGSNTRQMVVKLFDTPSVIEPSIKTVTLYPNPADNILNVKTETPIKSLTITSTAMGAEVLRTNNVSNYIDISRLNKGTYIVSIKLENGTTETHTIIKK